MAPIFHVRCIHLSIEESEGVDAVLFNLHEHKEAFDLQAVVSSSCR